MWLARAEADGFDMSQPASLTGAQNLLTAALSFALGLGESPQTLQSSEATQQSSGRLTFQLHPELGNTFPMGIFSWGVRGTNSKFKHQ